MSGVTESFKTLNKSEASDTFWNWNQNPKKTSHKWRLDQKRFSPNELFTTHPTKNAAETLLLGPGSGAGIGCGAGFGVGLVGGVGYSGWGWNHLRLVFGFGVGCGIGVGFGYGQGFGYGSDWETIKSDVLGFKKKKDPPNRVVTYI
ncbi:hypothetical protein RND81_03G179000 [Saponaria officinalis]|uniref:Uncharacterized protein n=1 Tax=Saponaria officinalis TaxID=3572 RepID=A0AAW1M157_SAPOF